MKGQLQSPYEDEVVSTPKPGSAAKGMSFGDKSISGDPGPTKGIMGEVQYSALEGESKKGGIDAGRVRSGSVRTGGK